MTIGGGDTDDILEAELALKCSILNESLWIFLEISMSQIDLRIRLRNTLFQGYLTIGGGTNIMGSGTGCYSMNHPELLLMQVEISISGILES